MGSYIVFSYQHNTAASLENAFQVLRVDFTIPDGLTGLRRASGKPSRDFPCPLVLKRILGILVLLLGI